MAVLEGPHLVGEALDRGLRMAEVLATPAFLASPEGSRLARRLPSPPLETAEEVLAGLADADSPRGILALAEIARDGAECLPRLPGAVYVFAESLQDPGNLGALARVCEAAAVAGLALSPGSAHPNHRRALRASAGSLLRLPVAVGVEEAALRDHLRELRPRWLALVPREGQPLERLDVDGTRVLALGSEGQGLSDETLRRADQAISIPLAAPVESLNATVAAALVLFEIVRRRRVR